MRRPWFRGLLTGLCGAILLSALMSAGQAGERHQNPPGIVAIAFVEAAIATPGGQHIPGSNAEATLLGGIGPRGWLPEDKAVPHFRAGRALTLFNSIGQSVGTVTLGTATQTDFNEHTRKITGKMPVSGEYLAASAPARPHVRPVNLISQQSPYYATYQGVVRDFLKAKGLTVAQPRIEKMVRTDLNGDGEEEVLILANSLPKGNDDNLTNYYSLALLRYVKEGGAVGVLPIIADVKRRVLENEVYRVELSGLVDLNGDGKTEIILRGAPYEGITYTAYTFDGRATREAFDFGWGP